MVFVQFPAYKFHITSNLKSYQQPFKVNYSCTVYMYVLL